MTGQLTTLTFQSADGSTEYDFLPNEAQRVTVFDASFQLRGQFRDKGAAQGVWPGFTYAGRQTIHHEGIIVGEDGDSTALERATMLSTILGDLGSPPTARKMGKLYAEAGGLAGWADVTVESYSAALRADRPTSIDYMISWVAFGPFLDDHGHPVVV